MQSTFRESLRTAWRILLFDKNAIRTAATNPRGIGDGILIALIAAIIAIGSLIPVAVITITTVLNILGALMPIKITTPMVIGMVVGMTIGGTILFFISAMINAFVGTAIYHLFAKLFGGHGRYTELLKPLFCTQLIYWIYMPILGIVVLIPLTITVGSTVLSIIVSLYMLILLIVIVKTVHSFSVIRAILTVIVPIILIGAISVGIIIATGAWRQNLAAGAMSQFGTGFDISTNIPEGSYSFGEQDIITEHENGCFEENGHYSYYYNTEYGTSSGYAESLAECNDYLSEVKAAYLQDASLCAQILTENIKGDCYVNIALSKQDRTVCAQAADQNDCYTRYDSFAAAR